MVSIFPLLTHRHLVLSAFELHTLAPGSASSLDSMFSRPHPYFQGFLLVHPGPLLCDIVCLVSLRNNYEIVL